MNSNDIFVKDSRSNGISKVFFSCHKDDFDYYSNLSADIFSIQNCSIYYLKDADYQPEDLEDYRRQLSSFQLFVFPITNKFLTEKNRSKDIDFLYAKNHKYPILPISVEPNLYEQFNQFAEAQLLDKTSNDITADSYEVKLTKYINSELVDNETAQKIKEAFDAYIFLSYRKKDRKFAQEIMSLIHKNDFMRDIAIWYDEFLTPGEDFNVEISENLLKSKLIALVVTPNINERFGDKGNYIIEEEYPLAVKENKQVIPIEALETDKEALKNNFKNIPDTINKENSEALTAFFKDFIIKNGFDSNDNDPEHLYFIGLAYFNGIDTERDLEKGTGLIRKSAELGYPLAQKKLSIICENIRLWEDSLAWQKKYITNNHSLEGEALFEEKLRLAELMIKFPTSANIDDAINVLKNLKDYLTSKQEIDYVMFSKILYLLATLAAYETDDAIFDIYDEYHEIAKREEKLEIYEFMPKFGDLFCDIGSHSYNSIHRVDKKSSSKYLKMAHNIFKECLKTIDSSLFADKNERYQLLYDSAEGMVKYCKITKKYYDEEDYTVDRNFYAYRIKEYNLKRKKETLPGLADLDFLQKTYETIKVMLEATKYVYCNEFLKNISLITYNLPCKSDNFVDIWKRFSVRLKKDTSYNYLTTIIIESQFLKGLFYLKEYNFVIEAYVWLKNISSRKDKPYNISFDLNKVAYCYEKVGSTNDAIILYKSVRDKLQEKINDRNILEKPFFNYSKQYWDKKEYWISNLLFEFGVDEAHRVRFVLSYLGIDEISSINDAIRAIACWNSKVCVRDYNEKDEILLKTLFEIEKENFKLVVQLNIDIKHCDLITIKSQEMIRIIHSINEQVLQYYDWGIFYKTKKDKLVIGCNGYDTYRNFCDFLYSNETIKGIAQIETYHGAVEKLMDVYYNEDVKTSKISEDQYIKQLAELYTNIKDYIDDNTKLSILAKMRSRHSCIENEREIIEIYKNLFKAESKELCEQYYSRVEPDDYDFISKALFGELCYKFTEDKAKQKQLIIRLFGVFVTNGDFEKLQKLPKEIEYLKPTVIEHFSNDAELIFLIYYVESFTYHKLADDNNAIEPIDKLIELISSNKLFLNQEYINSISDLLCKLDNCNNEKLESCKTRLSELLNASTEKSIE